MHLLLDLATGMRDVHDQAPAAACDDQNLPQFQRQGALALHYKEPMPLMAMRSSVEHANVNACLNICRQQQAKTHPLPSMPAKFGVPYFPDALVQAGLCAVFVLFLRCLTCAL